MGENFGFAAVQGFILKAVTGSSAVPRVSLDGVTLEESSEQPSLLRRDGGKVSQDGKPHRPGVKGRRSPRSSARRLSRDTPTMQTAPRGENTEPGTPSLSLMIQTVKVKFLNLCVVVSPALLLGCSIYPSETLSCCLSEPAFTRRSL